MSGNEGVGPRPPSKRQHESTPSTSSGTTVASRADEESEHLKMEIRRLEAKLAQIDVPAAEASVKRLQRLEQETKDHYQEERHRLKTQGRLYKQATKKLKQERENLVKSISDACDARVVADTKYDELKELFKALMIKVDVNPHEKFIGSNPTKIQDNLEVANREVVQLEEELLEAERKLEEKQELDSLEERQAEELRQKIRKTLEEKELLDGTIVSVQQELEKLEREKNSGEAAGSSNCVPSAGNFNDSDVGSVGSRETGHTELNVGIGSYYVPVPSEIFSRITRKKKYTREGRELFCNMCTWTCKQKRSLQDHIFVKHHGGRFKCTQCPRRFTWRNSVCSHAKIQHHVEFLARKRRYTR